MARKKGKKCFLITTENNGGVWQFFERPNWEVAWYSVKSTPALIAKAEGLLAAKE